LFVLHLTPRSETAQLAAIDRLHASLDALPPERPRVVTGDFNSGPESAAIRAFSGGRAPLRDAWRQARPDDPGLTMPAENPVIRIDYLFLSPPLTAAEAIVLGSRPDPDGFYPSDHRGVAVTVRDARNEDLT
jgi:endonuclease/exonuclease/phosphatase family metal-dependent hydrolase